MSVSIVKNHSQTITFNLLGQRFNYLVEGTKKLGKIKEEQIVPLLTREINQAEWEWGRKDDKKIILFYRPSTTNPGYNEFRFCVEADETLIGLMARRDGDSSENLSLMINYAFNNREKLNFNC